MMADISSKVDQIRKAVFGYDVRESIASGIESINDEVVDTTKRQDVIDVNESSRISAENTRTQNENNRKLSEQGRVSAESNRVSEFSQIKTDYNTASKFNVVTYKDWSFTASVDTTDFTIEMGIYNPLLDIAELSQGGVLLSEGDNYTRVGADVSLTYTLLQGETIDVRVFKGVINDPPTSDGSNLMDGSITKMKLSADITDNLDKVPEIETSLDDRGINVRRLGAVGTGKSNKILTKNTGNITKYTFYTGSNTNDIPFNINSVSLVRVAQNGQDWTSTMNYTFSGKRFIYNGDVSKTTQISIYGSLDAFDTNDEYDYVAIQTAILNAEQNGYAEIFIPAGTFLINKPLVMRYPIKFVGAGIDKTIIKKTSNFVGDALIKYTEQYNNSLIFEDFTIEDDSFTLIGISLDGYFEKRPELNRIKFVNCAIGLFESNIWSIIHKKLMFSDCSVGYRCGSYGSSSRNSYINFNGCEALPLSNGSMGIDLYNVTAANIIDCNFYPMPNADMHTLVNFMGVQVEKISMLNVKGNQFEQIGRGIVFKSSTQWSDSICIEDNKFHTYKKNIECAAGKLLDYFIVNKNTFSLYDPSVLLSSGFTQSEVDSITSQLRCIDANLTSNYSNALSSVSVSDNDFTSVAQSVLQGEIGVKYYLGKYNPITALTFYIDTVNGLDSNDGLSESTPIKTFTQFNKMLPQQLTGQEYVIKVKSGSTSIDLTDFKLLNKRFGNGIVTLDLQGQSLTIGGQQQVGDSFVFNNNIRIRLYNGTLSGFTNFYIYNSEIELYKMTISGTNMWLYEFSKLKMRNTTLSMTLNLDEASYYYIYPWENTPATTITSVVKNRKLN